MNATVYYQKTQTNPKGQKIYIGEDAYPYVDKHTLIVADGLGGRGGYPHTKIDRRILDKSAFYDIVFAPVFSADVSEEFRTFVTNSFAEIFETKDYYFENYATTRSSGYYASRLASAITLYELKYNDDFKKEAVFAQMKTLPDQEKQAYAQQLGDKLTVLLREKLSTIAQNVGFCMETVVAGAYLLPSTLTVALIDEHEGDADVLYLWVGDSRGYVWDADGLGQVTEDHEKDEAMTNIISLTKPFRVEGRVINVKKPCLLFNASDGCYKCPVFASPFDLEYIFLMAIDLSASFEQFSAFLCEQFAQLGQHDDSNTMALIPLGFDTYASVQQAVRARMRAIDESVVKQLPGILEIDYPGELHKLEMQLKEKTSSETQGLIEQEEIAEFVRAHMERAKYKPYTKELAKLIERNDAYIFRHEEVIGGIRAWVKRHWIEYPQLKKYSPAAKKLLPLAADGMDPFTLYAALRSRLSAVKAEHADNLAEMIEKLRETSVALEKILARVSDIKQANALDEEDFLDEACSMREVLDMMKAIDRRETPAMIKYRVVVQEIQKLNSAYAEFDACAVESVLNEIILGTLDLKKIKMHVNERAAIEVLLQEYEELEARIAASEDEINELPYKHLQAYWSANCDTLVAEIRREQPELLPDPAALSQEMEALVQKAEELRRCCELRERIYAEYDVIYRRFYEESKL